MDSLHEIKITVQKEQADAVAVAAEVAGMSAERMASGIFISLLKKVLESGEVSSAGCAVVSGANKGDVVVSGLLPGFDEALVADSGTGLRQEGAAKVERRDA